MPHFHIYDCKLSLRRVYTLRVDVRITQISKMSLCKAMINLATQKSKLYSYTVLVKHCKGPCTMNDAPATRVTTGSLEIGGGVEGISQCPLTKL